MSSPQHRHMLWQMQIYARSGNLLTHVDERRKQDLIGGIAYWNGTGYSHIPLL